MISDIYCAPLDEINLWHNSVYASDTFYPLAEKDQQSLYEKGFRKVRPTKGMYVTNGRCIAFFKAADAKNHPRVSHHNSPGREKLASFMLREMGCNAAPSLITLPNSALGYGSISLLLGWPVKYRLPIEKGKKSRFQIAAQIIRLNNPRVGFEYAHITTIPNDPYWFDFSLSFEDFSTAGRPFVSISKIARRNPEEWQRICNSLDVARINDIRRQIKTNMLSIGQPIPVMGELAGLSIDFRLQELSRSIRNSQRLYRI